MKSNVNDTEIIQEIFTQKSEKNEKKWQNLSKKCSKFLEKMIKLRKIQTTKIIRVFRRISWKDLLKQFFSHLLYLFLL